MTHPESEFNEESHRSTYLRVVTSRLDFTIIAIMISRIAITSFTASLLLLPSHVVGLIAPCPPGTTVGIVGGDPACVQDDNCIFGIEYSEDGCWTSVSAVSLVAYLVNETYTFVAPTSEELSCARSTMCRINPSDELCVGANEFPLALDYDSSTGLIFGADDPSFIVGPDACLAGGWIPQCLSYNYQLLSDLKDDPSMLANDNPEDLAMMTDYLYLLYYEDDTCTDLAGITPAVSGSALSVPIVSNPDLSCQAQAMCAIDPDSKICESIRDQNGETALLTLETRGDEPLVASTCLSATRLTLLLAKRSVLCISRPIVPKVPYLPSVTFAISAVLHWLKSTYVGR